MRVILFFQKIDINSEADTGFPERGGVGCRGYGYFILGHFVVGHIVRCTDKILGDKMPVEIARGNKMPAILWDREGKMPILSKHIIFDTDDQVN